ncbi:hypothetical protein C922_05290 [Plasmodium inui San Antonio 1]|uniref:Uncharacterized protein n=1 Tax=Plasmodium inui San Antonio 1 TaxID=1237626 RepID=W7AG93_9APIC|nr:hypothetical protein C922_05290 [Plasmodium inui San Antonio 1]EUD64331.1 hypothetical protein C922_05290 [Plasmodium inui San Antonio 1]
MKYPNILTTKSFESSPPPRNPLFKTDQYICGNSVWMNPIDEKCHSVESINILNNIRCNIWKIT